MVSYTSRMQAQVRFPLGPRSGNLLQMLGSQLAMVGPLAAQCDTSPHFKAPLSPVLRTYRIHHATLDDTHAGPAANGKLSPISVRKHRSSQSAPTACTSSNAQHFNNHRLLAGMALRSSQSRPPAAGRVSISHPSEMAWSAGLPLDSNH